MVNPSSYPSYPQQPPWGGAPVRRDQKAFRQFVQNVAPDPTPTRSEFYIDNMVDNAIPSYEKGFIRYFDTLRKDPVMGASVAALTLGLGFLLTAFRSHKKFIQASVLLALLGYPVAAFVRHFPKIMDSYELMKEGEPSKAKEEFKKSFNELVYNVFHVYLKPLSLSLFVVFPLMNAKETLRWLGKYMPFEKVKRSLKGIEKTPPIEAIDGFARRLDAWGDGVIQKIYRVLPFAKKYREKTPLK